MTSIIIVFIIYVVTTFIKSSVKRAAESFDANRPGQALPPEETSVETSLEELIKRVILSKEETNSQEVVAVPVQPVAQPKVATQQPKAPEVVAKESDKPETEPTQTPVQLRTRDEARRAFIYSEIFNRKYE